MPTHDELVHQIHVQTGQLAALMLAVHALKSQPGFDHLVYTADLAALSLHEGLHPVAQKACEEALQSLAKKSPALPQSLRNVGRSPRG